MSEKHYYEREEYPQYEYNEVTNPTGNPSSQGWYENTVNSGSGGSSGSMFEQLIPGSFGYSYELTEDTTVVSGKTYYSRDYTYTIYEYVVVTNPTGNPSSQGWYETESYNFSIPLNAAGQFTPTITIEDSRGQTTTKTLNSITVEEVPPPTFTTSDVTTNTGYDYINHGVTTASIVISNIDSLYGTPTRATFGIGSQVVSGNLNGEDHITLSINIDQPALSNQSVWVRVYDSSGKYRQENKTSIHIDEYTYPSANVQDIYRVNDITKEPDDEGTYAVLKLMLSRYRYSTYVKFMQPTILIDGNTPQNTILWYSDENLTQQITWPWLEPPAGSHYYNGSAIIYGVLSEFEMDKTYSISITPNDNYYSGNIITTTLPQAFFTLDVLAGGHGIAFGRSAKKEYFDVYMSTNFNEGVTFNNGTFVNISQNEALYTLLNSNKLLSKLQVPNVEIVMDDNWYVGADHDVVFIITYNNYLHDFEYQPNDFDIIFEELERPKEISIKDMWIDNSVGDNIRLIQKHTYETYNYYNGVISFKVIYKYKGMILFEETYSKQLIQLP